MDDRDASKLAFLLSPLFGFPTMAMASDHVSTIGGMLNSLNQYYDAEITGAFPFVFSVSIFALVLGSFMAARGRQFFKAMGWSVIVLSTGVAVGALTYSFTVPPKQQSFVQLLENDPVAYREKQLTALERTRRNFRRIILTDLALAAASAGLAAYGWSRRKRTLAGVGAGVMLSFLSLTAVEIHNRSRAISYEDSVRAFAPAGIVRHLDPDAKD